MFYVEIYNILTSALGLDSSPFGLFVADYLSVFLTVIFGLLPLVFSFAVLYRLLRR